MLNKNDSDSRDIRTFSDAAWPELSTVQKWFQAVVTHPDGIDCGVTSSDAEALMPLSRAGLEQIITRSERVSARDRLAIYANAYYARLLECLGESFPVLKLTLGEEAFHAFSFAYLQHYPSRSYTLGRLGDRFPEFLEETRPDQGDAEDGWPEFLIDLARLELAIIRVFDGPGIENTNTMSAEDLATVRPADWTHARLRTVPCLELLAVRFPLNEFYTAARRATEGFQPLPPPPADAYVVISRRDFIVRRHDLSRPQYLMLRALQEGRALADAIEAAFSDSTASDEAVASELHAWFRQWTSQQFFSAIELIEDAS